MTIPGKKEVKQKILSEIKKQGGVLRTSRGKTLKFFPVEPFCHFLFLKCLKCLIFEVPIFQEKPMLPWKIPGCVYAEGSPF